MLTTRALTAVVLIALFLAALYFLPRPAWAALAALLLVQAAWEWGGLAGAARTTRIAFSALLTLAFVAAEYDPFPRITPAACMVATAFWVLLAPPWLRRRPTFATPAPVLLAGAIVLLPAFFALVEIRDISPSLLLAVMALVWISDTAAYLVGRRFGRRKLAPSISPGKTWEGVAGAFAGVAVYAALWIVVLSRGDAPVWPVRGGAVSLALLAAVLTAAGIVGDLFESQLKRAAGVKDSGALLPGHGGLLDRIDALVPVLPLAALALRG